MTIKNLLLATGLAMLAGAPTIAAQERMEAWGEGVSEFEAVKSAYKEMIGKALKLSLDRAGTMQGSIRRGFVRDLEEDLLMVQSTYFPQSAKPACTEERERFQCHVVANAQMDEIESRLRGMLGETGSASSTVRDLRLALMSTEGDVATRDLATWLHTRLETDFGHDVYLSQQYVDADALRDGCGEYRKRAEAAEARGDNFRKTAADFRRGYTACKDLVDRDLILVIEGADSNAGAFDSRAGAMPGEMRLRLRFLQTRSQRPLPAPKPYAITQYGYGDNSQLAQSNLRDRLYDAAANYVAQQLNDVLVNVALGDGRVAAQAEGRDFKVLVSGVNTDDAKGRAQLALIRDWFAREGGLQLADDFTQGNFGERVYRFHADRAPEWGAITDRLSASLDKAGEFARVDVDRSQNLTVAFQANDFRPDKKTVTLKVEDKRAKRRVVIEESSMEVRRRDPESGVAIAVNEAIVRIRNKTAKDLLIVVNPVWRGQDGSSLPAPYSYRQTLRLPAKSSERFTFMAPSKFAGPVNIEVACPERACEMPQ